MAMLRTAPTRGLTVIELMVVVALLGVLVALAAPSLRGMIAVQRVRAWAAHLLRRPGPRWRPESVTSDHWPRSPIWRPARRRLSGGLA